MNGSRCPWASRGQVPRGDDGWRQAAGRRWPKNGKVTKVGLGGFKRNGRRARRDEPAQMLRFRDEVFEVQGINCVMASKSDFDVVSL